MLIRGAIHNRCELRHTSNAGDNLSIALSSPAQSSDTWHLTVYVTTDAGLFYVGELDTRAEDTRARIVATASIPGAKNWTVDAFSADPRAVAQLYLADGEGQSAPGLHAVTYGPHIIRLFDTDLTGAFYCPSNVGMPVPKSGKLSLIFEVTGDLVTIRVEASPNDFATTVNITPAGLNVSSVTTPYADTYDLDADAVLQLDFDDLRANRYRIFANGSSAASHLRLYAIEGD